MKAGMFERNQEPMGLLVTAETQDRALDLGTGEGNFYLQPHGVFVKMVYI